LQPKSLQFHQFFDKLVKTPKTPFSVIPAKAGIQEYQEVLDPGACPGPDPGFAGVTALMTFCEAVFVRYQKPSHPTTKYFKAPCEELLM